jgi:hypothetical protein
MMGRRVSRVRGRKEGRQKSKGKEQKAKREKTEDAIRDT